MSDLFRAKDVLNGRIIRKGIGGDHRIITDLAQLARPLERTRKILSDQLIDGRRGASILLQLIDELVDITLCDAFDRGVLPLAQESAEFSHRLAIAKPGGFAELALAGQPVSGPGLEGRRFDFAQSNPL